VSDLAAAPPLSREEAAIVKGYGDWSSFMPSYGLKPWNFDDADEGKRILEGMVANDKEDEAEAARAQAQATKKGKK
jgi:hypothetical protein